MTLQEASQRPTAKELQAHRFVAGARRAAAQAALLPLIRLARDHLSAAAVRLSAFLSAPCLHDQFHRLGRTAQFEAY